jgi:hypothetical protein
MSFGRDSKVEQVMLKKESDIAGRGQVELNSKCEFDTYTGFNSDLLGSEVGRVAILSGRFKQTPTRPTTTITA